MAGGSSLPPAAPAADVAGDMEAQPERGRAARRFTLEQGMPWFACLWLAVVLLLRWPALWAPSFASESALDSAFFGYAGQLVRLGGTPYLTFWDHKAPLIFLVDAAALAVSGGRVWGLWALNLLVLLASVLAGHAAMKRAFGAVAAMLGTACYAFSAAALMPVNLTEGYVLPLQWVAVALLLHWQASRRSPLAIGAALGLVGALAFFLRANLIGAALSVGLALVVMLLGRRLMRDAILFVAGALGAAALVSLAIVAWLASAGALEAFWDQAFRYNFLYAASGLRSKVGTLHFGASMVTRYAAAPIALAGWVLCLRRVWAGRRDMRFPAVYLLAVLWMPIELVLGSLSGRQYSHYFATAFAPVALLAAGLVAEVTAFAPAALSRGQGVLAFRALAVSTALWAMAGTGMILFKDPARDRREQVAETAAYVRASTPSAAKVLVWGHAAEVHFFSDRLPASRFVYPLALLTPRYADAALVDGFVDELRASAPVLIIDATPNAAEGEDLVPALAAWNADWRYPKDAPPGRHWWSMTPRLRTFYDYVHANYVPVETVGPKHWVMYRRVAPAASDATVR